jgi:hypothetical protein
MRRIRVAVLTVLLIVAGLCALAPIAAARANVSTHDPVGNWENLTLNDGRTLSLSGWVFDIDNLLSLPQRVDISISGVPDAWVASNTRRPDVAATYNLSPTGIYGWSYTSPPLGVGTHTVSVTARNVGLLGRDQSLGSATITVPRLVDTPYPPVATTACAAYALIGARGSGEVPLGTNLTYPPYPNTGDGLGDWVEGIADGFVKELDQHNIDDVKVLPLQYPAAAVSLDLHYMTTTYIRTSVIPGAHLLAAMLAAEVAACPAEKIVLAGYSQGALALHLALLDLATRAPQTLSAEHLAAVALLADPGKVANGAEQTWERDPTRYPNYLASPAVAGSSGLWESMVASPAFASSIADDFITTHGPLPAAVTDRTVALCHTHDPACVWTSCLITNALGSPEHVSYDATETGSLGRWAADTALGIAFRPAG